ncbi:phosphatase PAP2 family protein [Shewanella maritima]|uniref:undecaprenyl-diphosphate phosphatase n=1 Tax=Shewanella maritima TaxID=2520507 RepID=A0A411PGS6_9GAMM|nr:phosphatase PAP2 family protein [Shewanella maritima]QBF82592.1 phosphatase PAP2 family protein [Shewanella maritima]
MKAKLSLTSSAIILSLTSTTAVAKSEILEGQSGTISEIGDVVQIALPAGALIGSLWIGDKEGAWQLTKGVATTSLITHTMKFGYGRLRPDGTESNSFPSGHTSAAFSGAAYIHHRYGDKWALPAYTAASFVGASRLWANRHFMDDVLAGGSIAVMTSLYFTDPYNASDLVVVPSFSDGNMGLAVSYTPGASKSLPKYQLTDDGWSGSGAQKEFHRSYSLFIGGFDTSNNFIQENGSPSFNLTDFSRESEPNTYAAAELEWGVAKDQYLLFSFNPIESRDKTTLGKELKWAGKSYSAGSEVISAYSNWSLTADYVFELLSDSDWIVELGAGVTFAAQTIRLDYPEGNNLGETSDLFVAPAIIFNGGYKFTEEFSLDLRYRASGLSQYTSQAYSVGVTYQINDRWSASLFRGVLEQEIDGDEYYNDAEFDHGGFAVTYAF